jgi:hypothetical protein
MKLETKRKIRRWVCDRLGLPETEKVPYPVNVYQATPVTLCAQGAFRKQPFKELSEIVEDATKLRLAVTLAEALIKDEYCGVETEESEVNPELRIMTVSVRVVPWKE